MRRTSSGHTYEKCVEGANVIQLCSRNECPIDQDNQYPRSDALALALQIERWIECFVAIQRILCECIFYTLVQTISPLNVLHNWRKTK